MFVFSFVFVFLFNFVFFFMSWPSSSASYGLRCSIHMAQDRKRGGPAAQKATLSQLVQGLLKQVNASEADDQWQSILIKAILQVVGDVTCMYI
jgi:hypothetical protein